MQDQPESSRAGGYGLGSDESARIVAAVEARYVPAGAGRRERAAFRKRLHVPELMLARACARGDAAAWEEFWTTYQPRLLAAARGLTREAAAAEELAGGLLGDLFGTKTREGARVCKLDHYMGLGSLEGWLVALLAQAYVDQWRRHRREVSLEESGQLQTLLVAPNQENGGEDRRMPARLEAVMERVLGGVGSSARLLLSLYFLDGQTLAQIAPMLGVHESTVSRRLERLLRQLRRTTRQELARSGFSRRAAEEALEVDPRRLRVDVRKFLNPMTPHDPSH